MAGSLPRNRGNRSATRWGSTASARLRREGINISPAARKHRFEGIFVSASGDYITVLVDLGMKSAYVVGVIADVVRDWGAEDVDTDLIQHETGDFGHVRFHYPHA